MARTTAALSLLNSRPSRRPHEVVAWLAAVCLVIAAAGYSPWMPWAPMTRTVLMVAFGTAAVALALLAGALWVSARRHDQAAAIDAQMAELDEQDKLA